MLSSKVHLEVNELVHPNFCLYLRRLLRGLIWQPSTISVRLGFLKCVQTFIFFKSQMRPNFLKCVLINSIWRKSKSGHLRMSGRTEIVESCHLRPLHSDIVRLSLLFDKIKNTNASTSIRPKDYLTYRETLDWQKLLKLFHTEANIWRSGWAGQQASPAGGGGRARVCRRPPLVHRHRPVTPVPGAR